MREQDPLVGNYQHLQNLPRGKDALHMLRKIASLAKPIMRKHGWRVGTLKEFLPQEQNLLGLNIDGGRSICLRLRHAGDKTQFLHLEQVTDTFLHELSHNVIGPHNEEFHKLWNKLRDEYTDLTLKGYTGEGFLSEGHRLGGRRIPMQEMRRQARVQAEKRRTLQKNSGQKLGGRPVLRGVDMRNVIADAAQRRMNITKGCASGTQGAGELAKQANRNGFRTKAEEDDANERAIAQALWELVQEDESRKAGVDPNDQSGGLTWDAENGLDFAKPSKSEITSDHRAQGTGTRSQETHNSTTGLKNGQSRGPSNVQNGFTPSSAYTQLRIQRPDAPLIAEEERRSRNNEVVDLTLFEEGPSFTPSASIHGPVTNNTWPCEACTLVNSIDFLCCDVCGSERPSHVSESLSRSERKPLPSKSGKVKAPARSLGWNCRQCGSFMENQWWTCSQCGLMKASS